MTNLVKRALIVLIGVLGGLCAWPLVELAIAGQQGFPSYFLFSAVVGSAVGLVLGAFFASAEGLLDRSPAKAAAGLLQGAIAGTIGGILSVLVAQSFLFAAGEGFVDASASRIGMGLIVARALGWAVVGATIGMSEGIRALSSKKILLGLAGGLLGGFLGGLLFTWISLAHPGFGAGRLLALMVMGGLIAFLYSILERRFAAGSLKAMNGPLKGKEFLVNQRRLTLGEAQRSDIRVRGYRDVAKRHAVFTAKGGVLTLSAAEGRVLVNDQPVESQALRLDDVIQVGSAKFLYGYFG